MGALLAGFVLIFFISAVLMVVSNGGCRCGKSVLEVIFVPLDLVSSLPFSQSFGAGYHINALLKLCRSLVGGR